MKKTILCACFCCALILPLWAAEKPAAPQTIEPGKSCVSSECHSEMGTKKFLHGPVVFGKCEPCHLPTGNQHLFEPFLKGRDLCLKCHQENKAAMRFQHEPFKKDCTACHVLHQSDQRYFVKGGLGPEGCVRDGCHEEFPRKSAFPHFSLEEGSCLVCHMAHEGNNENLLVFGPGETCTACHKHFPQRMAGAVSSHTPRTQNNCTECHNPHGGEAKYMVPADEKMFCRKCHDIVLDQMANQPVQHTSMVKDKSCRDCHEPHSSRRPHLLAKPDMDLCVECHDKEIKMEDGRTLPNIAAEIEGARFVHGPIREKNCAACHQAHGSANPNILKKAYPAGFLSKQKKPGYDCCFDCHDRGFVEEERSTTTAFRNGDQNLHYVHVMREKNGHSCRACHSAHASDQPKHIRNSTPFGQWEMPLEMTMTATGGGCRTPCHPSFRYDHVKPFENAAGQAPAIAPEEKILGRERAAATSQGTDASKPTSPHLTLGLHSGGTAPWFSLSDSAGEIHYLGENVSPTILLFLDPSDAYTTYCLDAFDRSIAQNAKLAGKVKQWIVLPRKQWKGGVSAMENLVGDSWRVLLDAEGGVYSSYRVFATPSAVLLEANRQVRLVQRGYDKRMWSRLESELEEIVAHDGSGLVGEPLTPIQLHLELARRLAARGLWDTALERYLEVASKEGLSPTSRIELAEVYLAMGLCAEAIEAVSALEVEPSERRRVDLLLKRCREILSGKTEEPTAPAITR